jgi:hypothetical protein
MKMKLKLPQNSDLKKEYLHSPLFIKKKNQDKINTLLFGEALNAGPELTLFQITGAMRMKKCLAYLEILNKIKKK